MVEVNFTKSVLKEMDRETHLSIIKDVAQKLPL